MSAGIILFIVGVLFVVMVHESGHFLVAKLFGFKATKFFLGFGPTLWSTTRGETEYGVKAIPLGGFVKIIGMNPYEEVPPEDRPRAYPSKPKWQRAVLLAAGSATHWVVAFLLLVVAAMTIGVPTLTTRLAEVGGIEGETTPAERAGLEPGDVIVAIDSKSTPEWEDVQRVIRTHAGQEVTLTIRRDGLVQSLDVTLATALFDPEDGIVEVASPGERLSSKPAADQEVMGFLGVSPTEDQKRFGLPAAVAESGSVTAEFTVGSIQGIGDFFGQVFGGEIFRALGGEGERTFDEGPLGLVGAGRIAGETVQQGQYLLLIRLIAGFAIFVGLMNLLPLPPLDGGHLAVLAYEAVTGRTVDVRKLIPVAAAVLSFFILLFLAALYLDIARPINIPF